MVENKIIRFIVIPVAVFLYLNLFRNALVDDSFIVLRYVKTILQSGTWGMLPGYTANTATSPLNVLLLVLITFLVKSEIYAVVILCTVCLCIAMAMLSSISRKFFSNELYGLLAVTAVIFNPFIVSTMGLEAILFLTIFIISFYCFISMKWLLLALSLGLLTITRADGILIFGIYLVFVPAGKNRWSTVFVYLLSIAPWYLFSWICLGSLLPDTLFIKLWQKEWWGLNFFNGLSHYLTKYPVETVLSFCFLPLVFISFFAKNVFKKQYFILGLIGILHFICYSLLHVPPYHWYYSIEIVVVIILGSFSVGLFCEKALLSHSSRNVIRWILIILFLIPPVGSFYLSFKDNFCFKEMPIHTNWATREQYETVALWLNKFHKGASILQQGEIGTLAFYSDCFLFNEFSDRRIITERVSTKTKESPFLSLLYKANFLFLTNFGREKRPTYDYRLVVKKNRIRADSIHGVMWLSSSKWMPNTMIIFEKI